MAEASASDPPPPLINPGGSDPPADAPPHKIFLKKIRKPASKSDMEKALKEGADSVLATYELLGDHNNFPINNEEGSEEHDDDAVEEEDIE
ncbi:hypothetical protein R1flu_027449 [Riccia fluitans]|uniref:Uncharacterized protein n=1 Tax=Riccia fluitans TaxID=41844 RepID=A0ABD1XLU5_9MARC